MTTPTRKTSPAEESEEPKNILVVDDEAPIREVLNAYLTRHGYKVTVMASGQEALRQANKLPIHLIILDVLLEDADGLELLEKFKTARPKRPVIIITGMGPDEELTRRALEKGAADCISKTAPLDRLLERIEGALHPKEEAPAMSEEEERRQAKRQEWAETAALAGATVEEGAPAELREAAAPIPAASQPPPISMASLITVTPEGERFDFGLEVFSRMLSVYHPNLGNNALRTVALCKKLGEVLGWPQPQIQTLLWAAALHDIALVRIERSVVSRWLREPDKCTKEETILIRRHPEQSQRMLDFCPALKEAGEIIATHHENWDGTGYPANLKMEMISWPARLLAVAIHYCSPRTPDGQTVKGIKTQADRMFDPKAVEAVLEALPHFTLPPGQREIMAYEVKVGMIPAEDIVNWDGLLVLGKGTALTNATVNKIANLSRAGQIGAHVLIQC